jgi:hypothetical protein
MKKRTGCNQFAKNAFNKYDSGELRLMLAKELTETLEAEIVGNECGTRRARGDRCCQCWCTRGQDWTGRENHQVALGLQSSENVRIRVVISSFTARLERLRAQGPVIANLGNVNDAI